MDCWTSTTIGSTTTRPGQGLRAQAPNRRLVRQNRGPPQPPQNRSVQRRLRRADAVVRRGGRCIPTRVDDTDRSREHGQDRPDCQGHQEGRARGVHCQPPAGLLFCIPVVGEAAGAAGLTAARSLPRLAGATGDSGLLLHDIIKSPENAFMETFSYLAAAGVGRAGFRNAANARRAMKSSDIDTLGLLKKDLDLIKTVCSITCCI